MKRILFIGVILIVFLSGISAQIYVPIDTANLETRKTISTKHKEASKQYITYLKKTLTGSEKSYIVKEFDTDQKDFNKELLHGDYIFDNRFDLIVDSLVDILQKGNTEITDDLKFYISRNISLNASSLGDKTFVINLGSFYYFDNENEMAAIIAHEIGHLLLNHKVETMKRHLQFDKTDAKADITVIRNEKYNRGTKALERYKSILYRNGSLNKKQEHEADSIGYVLYNRAKFKKADFLNAYNLMAEYDTIKPKGLMPETYRKVFDLPNQPFKEEWMKREDFSSYDYSKYKEKFDEDSLKSHPEIAERIAYLKTLFPELAQSENPTKPDSSFIKIQRIAHFERPASLDFNEEYGFGIYLCLTQLQKDSTDAYHRAWLGHFFRKVYDARKAYTLNRYLDRLEPKEQSESYQQFLSFMWNMNITELKTIADYYEKPLANK